MFESERQTAPEEAAQINLQEQKADETSGRPGEGEKVSPADRLQQTTPAQNAQDPYAAVELPPAAKGREEVFAAFKRLAAELKLPQEAVKKLVEWEAGCAEDGRKTADKNREEILENWTRQTKKMFGPFYSREIARALDAAQRFGGEELRVLFDATGLGSHPAVVRAFHEIAKQIGEDVSVGGGAAKTADKTFAEALYGKAG